MRYMTIAAFAGAIALAVGCGGGGATENCVKMIECDNAIADGSDNYTASWPDGLDDTSYGDGGTCYKGDKDACDAACESALGGHRTAAQALVDGGADTLTEVPAACD